jgi:hypothetical protein
VSDGLELDRVLAWPFPDDRFPPSLGAVVQRTVLEGIEPACIVGHTIDGSWYVGDGRNDPNAAGACIATHLRHVIERNSSIEPLAAAIPPGHEARRTAPGEPWIVTSVDLEP